SVADGATLVFSFTGFTDVEIIVGATDVIDVELSAGELLDEVVVTGYGTQKSREVTSSIASVKAEDFNQGNVNSPTQLLQGKVGGLVIARPGSNPNGDFEIRLRGLSSVGASSSPLIVIDGVLGGDLNSVEPQDIASIDVLKDASAAAIYGTRGAAGVILITTKKGVPGTSSITYNGQVSIESKDRVVDVLTADEYKAFGGGADRGANTDWFDEITQTGVSHTHNISMSGGTSQTTYRVSGNFRDVKGIARETGFDRLNFRANLTQKALNDKLTVTANITSSSENTTLGWEEAFRYATIHNPTSPIFLSESDPAFGRWDGYQQEVLFDYYNPVAIIDQNPHVGSDKSLTANIKGVYDLTDDLNIGVFYSRQRGSAIENAYFDKNSFWTGENRNGLARSRNDERKDQLFRVVVNYDKELASGTDLRLLGGYEYQDFEFSGTGIEAGDFLTDATTFNNFSGAGDFANGFADVFSYRNTNKLISFFGRANLNVNNTYFASASLRRDGSSRFGADEKWGLFPALSAGVDLVKAVNISGFDQLKLRVSYGQTGANVDESLLSLQRFGPGSNLFFFNGEYVPSYGPVSNANPNLKWERKTEYNVGIDFSILDYKLTGSVEYYNATTNDGLFTFNVSQPPNLFPSTKLNIGEVSNSGIEVALNYLVDLGQGKSWNIALSGSRWFTPQLNSLTNADGTGLSGGFIDGANLGSPGQNGTPLVRLQEGADLGILWGLVVDEDNPVSGDGSWNFVDVNGDGVQDDISDRAIIGNGWPKFNFGLNNSISIGKVDVNLFFRAVLGHDLINTFRAFYEAPSQISAYNILSTSADISNLVDQPQFSSYHVEDASFIKLDNATIGYTFDTGNTEFKKIRVYVTGQNLLTITGYSGVSPEPRLQDGSSEFGKLAVGIDRRNTYFSARGFTFGVNLGF
ncbi:MAG: TonB-linked SusC/RagA family outer membrane protein, partial [Saprospiraceae bacterium]